MNSFNGLFDQSGLTVPMNEAVYETMFIEVSLLALGRILIYALHKINK